MNEKTKQILRYVACGLGGLALGIALLGGLSMCATSNKTTAESVNKIYASPKREQINTGNNTGYRFEISSLSNTLEEYSPCYRARIYNVETLTYTLTAWALASDPVSIGAGWANITNAISTVYNLATPQDTSGLTFLVIEGYSDIWENGTTNYWYYYTFKTVQASTYQQTFVDTNNVADSAIKTTANNYAWRATQRNPIITTAQQTLFYVPVTQPNDYVFQDVESYYRELGYADGYYNGNNDGYNQGYTDGYYNGLQSANFFGSISATQNNVPFDDLSNATANYYTDYTAYFKIGSAIVGETNYYIWLYGYSQVNWSRRYWYLVFAPFDGSSWNMTQSYAQQYQLGFWLAPSDDPYTSSALTIYERKTNYYDNARMTGITNLALFEKLVVVDDYKTGADYYNDGYNQGYENGEATGLTQGYNQGYTEGYNQTNTKNVFSLFTSAFTAVGSFFNLQVFGFLPLYWFFLAPLFITLITLLLRMVKH